MQTIKLYYRDWYDDKYPIPNGTSNDDIKKLNFHNLETFNEFKNYINTFFESTRHTEFVMNQRVEEERPGLIKLDLDNERKIYLTNNHENCHYILFCGKVRYDSLDFEKVRELRSLGKPFLFVNLHEGSYDDWSFNKLKEEIKYDNCIFVSGNTIYEQLNNGIWFPFFAYSMGQEIKQYETTIRQFYLNDNLIKIGEVDRWLSQPKEKKYYSLNKSANRAHRAVLLLWLYKNGYLEEGYVSALLCEHIDYSDELFKIIRGYRSMRNLTKEISDEFLTKLPITLDAITPEEIREHASPKYNISNYYENTCFNIVTETDFFSKGCNITEKIFKPILNGQFFIPIGNMHLIKNLEKLGFKKYSIIDYSFDECDDDFERLDMVLTQIDKLLQLSKEELVELIKKDIDIIRENQKHFLSLNINDGFKVLFDKLSFI